MALYYLEMALALLHQELAMALYYLELSLTLQHRELAMGLYYLELLALRQLELAMRL